MYCNDRLPELIVDRNSGFREGARPKDAPRPCGRSIQYHTYYKLTPEGGAEAQ
jgi:hypothetical protein